MTHKINWHSLSDFRDYLLKQNKEKIISFNGYELITNKAKYGLLFGKLSITENKKKK